ncbi:MAG: TIGR00153 family protein [Planctomycetota bacterium]
MKGINPIASLFGRSPFKPMQEHVEVVEECAKGLIPFFEALVAGDDKGMETARKRVSDLEEQADQVKNQIRAHLPKSLFMPVDRRDLLDMLHAQDSIADSAQDVAELLTTRKMDAPDFMRAILIPYVQRNLDAVRLCRVVINELDELVEMGFKGRAADRVERMVSDLGAVESDTDRLGKEFTLKLFENEDSMKPVDVMFWYQLIEWIGDIADYAEDVGDRLRLLIAT